MAGAACLFVCYLFTYVYLYACLAIHYFIHSTSRTEGIVCEAIKPLWSVLHSPCPPEVFSLA